MSWYEKFQPHWKLDTLTQLDGDTGDSAQRVGSFLFLTWIVGEVNAVLSSKLLTALQSSRGRFRRSSDPKHWGFRPSNLSADQLSVLRLAMSALNYRVFNDTYKQQFLRFGFHQNFLRGTDDLDEKWKLPDIMRPEELACWIRHNKLWILWPLVFCIDLLYLLFPFTEIRNLGMLIICMLKNHIIQSCSCPHLLPSLHLLFTLKLITWTGSRTIIQPRIMESPRCLSYTKKQIKR